MWNLWMKGVLVLQLGICGLTASVLANPLVKELPVEPTLVPVCEDRLCLDTKAVPTDREVVRAQTLTIAKYHG